METRQIGKLLSVRELADCIGFHPETVRQMAREGRIPHIKVSNRLRFRLEDIEKWLRLREVAA
jgi:excisionase family DNA binding protein